MHDEMEEFMERIFKVTLAYVLRVNAMLLSRVNRSVVALQTRLEQKGILSPDDVLAIEQLQDELAILDKELSKALEEHKEDLDHYAIQDVMKEMCKLTNYPLDRALMRAKQAKTEIEAEIEVQAELALKDLEAKE